VKSKHLNSARHIRQMAHTGYRKSHLFHLCETYKPGRQLIGLRIIPSRGSHAFGSTFFQYLLCSIATCQTVSVAISPATIGGSSGGASPRMTFVTDNAELEIESRL
jgi:hypothetical protein